MNPPLCSKGHGPMKLVEVTENGKSLGFLWFCVNDEPGTDYCDECEDYVPEVKQMELLCPTTTTNP